ncbi:hypothetical protein NQ314_016876 [Rhamnusium bicolor]|uniref:Uncharacterized protein n=1 Tax=Rhamnusium bicolor TaxID=1586634 RepID=A0AAV8WVZ1_9CUCU|nr:hypothetical protein NQ314_016876 [Rhamnusium bicolor]
MFRAYIAAVFIALAVATVNAGVIGGVSPLIATPLSAGLVSSPVIAGPSVVASPLSAGIVGVPAPLALSRSIIATPHASVISAPAISPLAVARVAAW